MTREQAEAVKSVYLRLIGSEDVEKYVWSETDEALDFISYLTDEELVKECRAKYIEHCRNSFKEEKTDEPIYFFDPIVLDAIEAILNLYNETQYLPEINKYVLSCYLAMS